MLKKLLFTAALTTSFAALTIVTPAKADSFSASQFDSVSEINLTNLSNLTDSLESLTSTMNTTVTTVASTTQADKTAQQVQSKADELVKSQDTREAKLVNTAKKYLGVPYVWGGTMPAGFDCSGFTSYVYREALGIEIGRTTYNQMAIGHEVPVSQAKVGDVLVFYGGGHVGIYLGNGEFIHAPRPGENVKVSSFSELSPDYALEF